MSNTGNIVVAIILLIIIAVLSVLLGLGTTCKDINKDQCEASLGKEYAILSSSDYKKLSEEKASQSTCSALPGYQLLDSAAYTQLKNKPDISEESCRKLTTHKLVPNGLVSQFVYPLYSTSAVKDGHMSSLTAQNYSCPPSYAIKGINWSRSGDSLNSYTECTMDVDTTSDDPTISNHTDDIADGYHLMYLDRHNLTCQDGSALRGIGFEMNGENRIKSSVMCESLKVPYTCRKERTPTTSNGNTLALTNLSVRCGAGEVMKGLQLIRPDPNNLAFEYTCCKKA